MGGIGVRGTGVVTTNCPGVPVPMATLVTMRVAMAVAGRRVIAVRGVGGVGKSLLTVGVATVAGVTERAGVIVNRGVRVTGRSVGVAPGVSSMVGAAVASPTMIGRKISLGRLPHPLTNRKAARYTHNQRVIFSYPFNLV